MKIKIVSTYPPTECGIAEHTRHLVKGLKSSGINPQIVEIKDRNSSNPLEFISLAKKAAKDTNKDDIIHIQFHLTIFGRLFWILPGFYITFFLIWLKSLTKAKIVMTLHDSPSREYALKGGKRDKILFYYYKFIYIFLRRYVDYFIVHSKNGEMINIKEWGVDKNKITTLPLGLPTEIKKLNKQKCKKSLGLPKKRILLILGYIRNSKNYNVVLESLSLLNKEVILLIAGKIQQERDRTAYNSIIKKTNELKLNDRVKLLGFVENEKMAILLSAADVGIDLRSQGSGDFMSSTMAMQLSYNTPMLGTNIPSFENLKKEERCIETFKNNDADDLTKKIKDILYNKKRAKYLEKWSRKYWEKNNWNEIGKRTDKLYLSLFK